MLDEHCGDDSKFRSWSRIGKTLLDEKELAFLNGDYRFFEHALATLVSIHGDHRLVHTYDSLSNLWSNSN